MIDYTQIVDVRTDINTFIMKPGFGNPSGMEFIDVIELNQTDFQKHLFLFKRWLKKQRSPKDRVMEFECQDERGVFSFDKYRRIFNSRLKPEEHQELIGEGDFIL